jgi:hypothetical protein
MKSADDKTMGVTKDGKITDNAIEEQIQEQGVLNDLLRGEVTQEVMELRDSNYRVFRHADDYQYLGNGNVVTCTRMKNANGLYVDIADIKTMPQDMTIMRMNVDDFDEAYDIMTKNGFKASREKPIETETNKSIGMKSPTGIMFDLCQHIKE